MKIMNWHLSSCYAVLLLHFYILFHLLRMGSGLLIVDWLYLFFFFLRKHSTYQKAYEKLLQIWGYLEYLIQFGIVSIFWLCWVERSFGISGIMSISFSFTFFFLLKPMFFHLLDSLFEILLLGCLLSFFVYCSVVCYLVVFYFYIAGICDLPIMYHDMNCRLYTYIEYGYL